MLNAFYRQQAPNGWQVLGLAIDQPSAVRKFLQRIPLEFPVGLAGLGDVAGGEDQVGLAALRAVGAHRANQRTQDHVTVVGVAAPKVEVGDVQPAESHDRRSAQTGKRCRTGGLIGRTSF